MPLDSYDLLQSGEPNTTSLEWRSPQFNDELHGKVDGAAVGAVINGHPKIAACAVYGSAVAELVIELDGTASSARLMSNRLEGDTECLIATLRAILYPQPTSRAMIPFVFRRKSSE